MADLIEWSPPADKGNFIVDFVVWTFRVWTLAIMLLGGACLALFVVGYVFFSLIGWIH